jgi:hypothetical protein
MRCSAGLAAQYSVIACASVAILELRAGSDRLTAPAGVVCKEFRLEPGELPRYWREIVGRDARMRCEKSGASSAARAASLISERRRNSSNGKVVSIRPE